MDEPTASPPAAAGAEVLTPRERRWLNALLILATVIAFLVAVDLVTRAIYSFGDVILTFFLAWLLAFAVSPIGSAITRLMPWIPRALAVIVAYLLIVGVFLGALLALANSLAGSISDFLRDLPSIQARLPEILAPIQQRITDLGLNVNLPATAAEALDQLGEGAVNLLGPVQELAVAGLGALGSLLIIFFLSVYIAVDAEAIGAFLYRLVPPRYAAEAALLQSSIARSFGGFIRGQALMGLIYGAVAAIVTVVWGLPFGPLTAVTSGVLQAIPFFGPFVSWAPPVVVAVFARSDAIIPVFLVMMIGWFVVMNVVQPRLLAEAVGVHPVVVLASVIIGAKVAGIAGAIFGIPVAAIVSVFFFHLVQANVPSGSVAARAARRLGEREGRPVRIPREPKPGVDTDIVEPAPE